MILAPSCLKQNPVVPSVSSDQFVIFRVKKKKKKKKNEKGNYEWKLCIV